MAVADYPLNQLSRQKRTHLPYSRVTILYVEFSPRELHLQVPRYLLKYLGRHVPV